MAAVIAHLCACGTNNSTQSGIVVAFTAGFTPPTGMNYSEACGIAATVSNDIKNQGVNWKAACNGSSCGSFSPANYSASAVPVTYTAPASGGATSVTITAISISDPTKSVTSAPIPIGQGSSGCS